MILPTEKPAILSATHPHYSTKKRHHCVSFCDDITVVEFECDKCPSSVSKPPICVSRNLRNTLFLPQQVSMFFDRYLPYETEERNIRTLMSNEMKTRKQMTHTNTLDALKLTLLNNFNNLKLTIPTKSPPNTRDEFLSMTAKERQWLATIQIHQLSEVAYTDYYFKQYMARTQPGVVVPNVSDYLKELKMNNVKKLQECVSPDCVRVRYPVVPDPLENSFKKVKKNEDSENLELLNNNLGDEKKEEVEGEFPGPVNTILDQFDDESKQKENTEEGEIEEKENTDSDLESINLDTKKKEGETDSDLESTNLDNMKKEGEIESFELVTTESCNMDDGEIKQKKSSDSESLADVNIQEKCPTSEIDNMSLALDNIHINEDNVKQEDLVIPEPRDNSLEKNLDNSPLVNNCPDCDHKDQCPTPDPKSSSLKELKNREAYPTPDSVNRCLGKPDGCLGRIPLFTVAHARQVLESKLLVNHTSNRRLESNPLLTIEYYYDLYMQIQEELDIEKRASLVAYFTSKLLRVQDVAHFMNISKGQKLYYRLYEIMEDRWMFWKVIFQSLSQFFNHNKSTRPLNAFLSLFKSWLMTNSDLAHVVILATTIENILSFLIADKFGMSVISLLVICSSNVKVILNSREEDREQWASFLTKLIQNIDHHPHVENPLVGSRKHLVQFLNAIAPNNVHLRY